MNDSVYPALNLQLMCIATEDLRKTDARQADEMTIDAPVVSETRVGLELPSDVKPRSIDQRQLAAFEVSFESAIERLGSLTGVFVEPDGFFMWHSRQDEPHPWQLSGMVYDRPLDNNQLETDNRVCWCEFKGTCPLEAWQSVVGSLGTAEERLVAYLQQFRCFVRVSELKHFWS